jgi:hypothetical protein
MENTAIFNAAIIIVKGLTFLFFGSLMVVFFFAVRKKKKKRACLDRM